MKRVEPAWLDRGHLYLLTKSNRVVKCHITMMRIFNRSMKPSMAQTDSYVLFLLLKMHCEFQSVQQDLKRAIKFVTTN